MKTIFFTIVNLFFYFGLANNDRIAKVDRSTYPFAMHSKTDFDVASKFENLIFLQAFQKVSLYNENQIKTNCGIKQANMKSVEAWVQKTKKLILKNLNEIDDQARTKHLKVEKNMSWNDLIKLDIEKNQPKNVIDWIKTSKKFHEKYVLELIRLAALHPTITSEIETISDNELTGHEFKDKNFLLTFDDGPTGEAGNTDKTIKMLNARKVNAIFFVLGQNLKTRIDKNGIESIQQLYQNQLLASHGYTHVGHQKYSSWKESLDKTENLIKKIQNKTVHFRGPYGQRNKEITTHLNNKNAKHYLWNIDSQDWHKTMTAKIIADRQITLMLLWRNGILLFHDIHPKSLESLPIVIDYFQNAGITWMDAKK